MSSLLNQARERALRPMAGQSRPRLTVVPKVAARAPRIPFVLLVVTVLAAGLVGLLLLNTTLQSGAYQVTALQQTAKSLSVKKQNLQTRVAELQQPQRLANQARRLGMVQNDSPAFLSLSTGVIIGKAVPGVATNKVDVGGSVPTVAVSGGKIALPVFLQQVSGSAPAERHGGDGKGTDRANAPGPQPASSRERGRR